ncbi:MAG: hypothetical protein AWU57_212 [Marinobacter sp. T13-3]|nr:MAG: hypothetical protein AWU57_212 [Marinobacter sp. T13-3]
MAINSGWFRIIGAHFVGAVFLLICTVLMGLLFGSLTDFIHQITGIDLFAEVPAFKPIGYAGIVTLVGIVSPLLVRDLLEEHQSYLALWPLTVIALCLAIYQILGGPLDLWFAYDVALSVTVVVIARIVDRRKVQTFTSE